MHHFLEFVVFLTSGGISALFNRALFSGRLGNWGHYVNHGIITVFFVFMAFLIAQKRQGKEPSSQLRFLIYTLLGWLVGASWMAKYVR